MLLYISGMLLYLFYIFEYLIYLYSIPKINIFPPYHAILIIYIAI